MTTGKSEVQKFLSCIRHHWGVVAIWSGIVWLGHHYLPLVFNWPDQAAYTFLSRGIASTRLDYTPQGVVVSVDTNRYLSAPYFGETPTNRCALLQDLKGVVSQNPKALLLDLDISPTYRDILKENLNDSCQESLDNFLVETSKKLPLVLIDPLQFEKIGSNFVDFKIKWRSEMIKHGISFGHADIRYSSTNVITQFSDKKNSGKSDEIEESISFSLCEKIKCRFNNQPPENTLKYINYMDGTFDSIDINNIANEKINGKIVFFGFKVYEQDMAQTPLGTQYGVDVHAAHFDSLQKPINQYWPLDIGLDFIIGLFIVFFAEKIIHNPSLVRKSTTIPIPVKIIKDYSPVIYLWVVLLISLAIIFSLSSIIISYFFLAYLLIWTSPIAMIFAITLDVFCRIPIEALNKAMEIKH